MIVPSIQNLPRNPRILIVEDEALIAIHIADILQSHGFEVVGTCQSVLQAFAHLENNDCCDAAILDAHLRNESASAVATALAQRKIPFVVFTGHGRAQLPTELASAPVLAKPVNTEDLISEVKRLLVLR